MAITLGTFTKQDNGTFTGTLKTLNVTAALSIVPVDKHPTIVPIIGSMPVSATRSERAGARSPKLAARPYMNLKIAAPEFGPNWVRCRLVKLEQAGEDGTTHIALWEPRDR